MQIHPQHRPQGIALIIVMLVIVVLGMLVASFSYSMKVETRLAQNVSSEEELLWLGRSGVELATWYLAAKDQDPLQAPFDSLAQQWAGGPIGTNEPLTGLSLEYSELGRGSISVQIIDQERRFNINLARRDVLERSMELLGVASLDADEFVDSIEDWRDPDSLPSLNGAEDDDYLALPPPTGPHFAKNGPIDDLTELLLVQGIGPDLLWGSAARYPNQTSPNRGQVGGAAFGFQPTGMPQGLGLADLFNTSGARLINVNTASRAVLQLLPGMDENLADAIVRSRAGNDGLDGTEDDTPFLNPGELASVGGMPPQYVAMLSRLCAVKSVTFEIRVKARVDAYERTYVAVVARPPRGPVGAMPVMRAYWE